MTESPHDLARRLADQAETVCRQYLSNGRRQGNYWLVGDARNTPGRSMFVRLKQTPKGAAGKWSDAATGEHGDLLDVIRESRGFTTFKDVAAEACAFLGTTQITFEQDALVSERSHGSARATKMARRLFQMSRPIQGTLVETYLRRRAIGRLHDTRSLRFHPRCYYRADEHSPVETWPAMIAAVTDLDGKLTGVHRTWLDPDGFDPLRFGKAPLSSPRRAMGELLGHAVRFGCQSDVMAAGEGIETILSLRCILPSMAMAAALSAAHLTAVLLPKPLRRLYVARDKDPAGDAACERLAERARAVGVEALVVSPALGDFNQDLRLRGLDALQATVRVQLAPQDVARFLDSAT